MSNIFEKAMNSPINQGNKQSDANDQANLKAQLGITNPKSDIESQSGEEKKLSNCLEDIISYTVVGFGCIVVISFVLGLVYGLPIAIFVMNYIHRSEMVCHDSFISPYIWMNVEGITETINNTINALAFAYWLVFKDVGGADKTFGPLTFSAFIVTAFHTAWIICGAVMFWRDCPHLEDNSMNKLYTTVLIIGLASIVIRAKILTSKEEEEQTNRRR